MKRPSVRIVTILVVIAFLAVDFGWLRHILTGKGSFLGFDDAEGVEDLGILTMLNLLGFGLLSSRGRPRRFLLGFEIGGCLAIGLFVGACWTFPHGFRHKFVAMNIQHICNYSLLHLLPGGRPYYNTGSNWPASIVIPLLVIYTLVLTLPLLVAAVIGGMISRSVVARPSSAS